MRAKGRGDLPSDPWNVRHVVNPMCFTPCSKTRPPSRLDGRLGAIRTSAAATLPQSANKIGDQLCGPFKRLIGPLTD